MSTILVTGGTGFVGRRLVERLLDRGDEVTVLSRDATKAREHLPARARSVAWDYEQPGPWTREVDGVDAVVHLSGEPVAQRWSADAKARITRSRVLSTQALVEAIGAASRKPKVFVSASAIGFYGARAPEDQVDEKSEPGNDFLAEVVKAWEAAARGAEALGVRCAQVRLGVVLGDGGALDKMIIPFKLFVGGPIGDGKQIVSWVHREDVVGILLLALDDERVRGPINAVSPSPTSNAELAHAIGAVMHRPSSLPTPGFALELAMGEAAAMVLTGQRVVPSRALELGYAFTYPSLTPALASILGEK